jgi:hypothetical protein
VSAGAAAAAYALPAGTTGGTYTIRDTYNGTNNFAGDTDTSHDLLVSAAASATATANASATFSGSGQSVDLSATVTSPAGTVNEGTETFTILNGTTVIGTPVTVSVSAGAAAAAYALPGGTAGGTYTIRAAYNGTSNLLPFTDTSHDLIVGAAAAATATAAATASFSAADQTLHLAATATSAAGTVNEGTETFTLLSGTTVIGTPVTVNVSAGAAAAAYTLPGGTSAGAYTIQATYNGTNDYLPDTDNTKVLTVTAVVTAVSVEWGSESVVLQLASDGVRLLPSGRSTDLPWYNINRIAITLSQAETVSASDVTVSGISGGSYGPVSVSGSGTTQLLITLAEGITAADRVTVKIGNSSVTTYTGRIDVLPGDVNDDGYVNVTDGSLILANSGSSHTYNQKYDFNGDGSVATSDYTQYRPFIGTTLPALPPQLAAGGEGPGGGPVLTAAQVAPVLAAAIDEWAALGLPAALVARLQSATVQITNLPAGYLGTTAIDGDTVFLSADAAGYGWFVDSAPWSPGATPAGAVGHEDLLTVVEHELGHTLGLSDLDPSTSSGDLMALTLATGVQRLPSARDVAAVLAQQSGTAPTARAFPAAATRPNQGSGIANTISLFPGQWGSTAGDVPRRSFAPGFLPPLTAALLGVDPASVARAAATPSDPPASNVPGVTSDPSGTPGVRPGTGEGAPSASAAAFGSRDVPKDDLIDTDL